MASRRIDELLKMTPQKQSSEELSDADISKNIAAMVKVFGISGVNHGDKPTLEIVSELNVSRKLIKECDGNPDTITQQQLDAAWVKFMSEED